jgi:hypothetical protein
MATVDSSSNLAEVEAAYDDNASYAEDQSTTKARAFVTACRILIRRYPSSQASGDAAVTLPLTQIKQELDAAVEWMQMWDVDRSPTEVSWADMSDFRGP